ncbi:aldo/keto reductase [Lapidilactobacillus luobeiensis]|uniref:aldo/keto reductase n=1 Tax=Lapidilactobacillus luobeiensis TaxID=2950371 RepID=UPI0021C38114|nr:aldo/keto reductase [Lapidilactobacillus luobeiensis]
MYAAATDRYEKLPYRRVGDTGLQLPIITLGLWRHFSSVDPFTDREKLILKAFDNGIFSFDIANNYGSPDYGSAEKLFGEVYQRNLKPYRDELVVTTKAGFEMGIGPYQSFNSRKSLLQCIDHSLTRLKMDYVDIFYSHRPDPNTDPEETALALAQIVQSGKAIYIGISNYDADQSETMISLLNKYHVPFVVNQYSYNMLRPEAAHNGVLETIKRHDRGLVAYGPLAEGLLTERYLDGIPEDFPIHRTNTPIFAQGKAHVVTILNQLEEVAQNRNQTLAQMALAWLLRDPAVTSVLIGTTSEANLMANLDVAKHLDFNSDEVKRIKDILA